MSWGNFSLRRTVSVAATMVGFSFLGLRAYQAVPETRALIRPASLGAADVAYRELSCVNEAFRSMVPVGAKVFIDIADPFKHQIAVVAAFPDRAVVWTARDASIVLRLRSPAPPDPCRQSIFDVSEAQPR